MRLPFLLKVIAAEQALSVQVHPGAGQVAAAMRSAPGRTPQGRSLPPTFVDSYGKPELLVAVEPFEALVGLRDSRRAAELLGVDPRRCLVIEDAPAGITAAKAAGATVLALETTHGPDDLGEADHRTAGLHQVSAQADGDALILRWKAAATDPHAEDPSTT